MGLITTKYPHAEAFLKAHPGWTIDQAIAYFEELEGISPSGDRFSQ